MLLEVMITKRLLAHPAVKVSRLGGTCLLRFRRVLPETTSVVGMVVITMFSLFLGRFSAHPEIFLLRTAISLRPLNGLALTGRAVHKRTTVWHAAPSFIVASHLKKIAACIAVTIVSAGDADLLQRPRPLLIQPLSAVIDILLLFVLEFPELVINTA